MGALAQIVASGKALYVGLSNYDGPTLEKAAAILDEMHVPFIINQNRYNIFDRTVERNGLKETSQRLGLGLITFSPLDQGLLTDRYLDGVIPSDSRIATDGRFLHDDAVTSVLVGASKPEQLLANLKALENTEFTDRELSVIKFISLA